MAFVVYSDEKDEWGYLPETTWGTSNGAAGNYRRIKFPKGTRIDSWVTHDDLDLNRAARQQVLADLFSENYSGPVRVSVPEVILTLDRAADLLYACLQNRVSQGAASLYLKQYKAHLSQPDFAANAGYFFTLAYNPPVSAKGCLITSCIVQSLELEWDKTGKGGQNLVRVRNLVIVGKKIAIGQTMSGTWVDEGTTRFNPHDFTYKYNDSDAMEWARFTLSVNNGAEPIDKDTDGTPKSFFLNWPKDGLRAEAMHWYNANTTGTIVDLLSDYNAGTSRLYSIQTSAANDASGHLKIQFYGKLAETPMDAQNRHMMAPARFIIGHNSVSTNDAIIIDIADSISQ
jgi:hypothetical protein